VVRALAGGGDRALKTAGDAAGIHVDARREHAERSSLAAVRNPRTSVIAAENRSPA
jgi:hypothetical protein